MDPAQGMAKHVELPGIVTDDAHRDRKAALQQAAHQCPFGRDQPVAGSADTHTLEVSLPGVLVLEAATFFQQVELDLGQFVLGHICQCPGVEHIVLVPGPQQAQEVHPALALGALKPGEEFVADIGAVTVLAVVSGARVVRLEVMGDLQPHFQHRGLLCVKNLMLLDQQVTQLAGRDLDPEFVQLLQQ